MPSGIPENLGLGRLEAVDERDANYPMSAVLSAEPPERDHRYWWSSGWWGNQGPKPQCVAYAWLHLLEDGPVTQAPRKPGVGPVEDPEDVYNEAQRNDEWSGEDYDGTSVRAGAKVLQARGYISEYRWAWDIDAVCQAVLELTPVVMGTWWYSTMFHPDDEGFVTATGSPVGGHAYLMNGVNLNRGIARFKNSWGREWGKEGHFYMALEQVEKLLNEGAEACIATEVNQ